MPENKNENLAKGNALLVKITIVFFAFIVVLIIFSTTIYQYNLPAVTLGYVTDGFIVNTLRSEGMAYIDGEIDIISDYGGRVDLFVSEGDTVRVGDVIYSVTLDTESIEDEIQTLENNRDSLTNNIAKLNNDIAYQNQLTADYDTVAPLDLSLFDLEILTLEKELERAVRELEKANVLLDNSAITLAEVEDKKDRVSEAEISLKEANTRREDAVENYNRLLTEQEKDNDESGQAKDKLIRDYEYQLNGYRIELDYTNDRIADLKDRILNDGEMEIAAEIPGIVTNIPNMNTGYYVQKNETVFKLQPEGAVVMAEFVITDKFDFMYEGDDVTLNIVTYNRGDLEGKIEDIYFENGGTHVKVSFVSQVKLSGGEVVEAVFEKRFGRYPNVLPNTAIHEGSNSTYILYAERVKGFFGDEFEARQISVTVENEDKNNSYFSAGDMDMENLPIILNSDMAVSEGTRVKIVGDNIVGAMR